MRITKEYQVRIVNIEVSFERMDNLGWRCSGVNEQNIFHVGDFYDQDEIDGACVPEDKEEFDP